MKTVVTGGSGFIGSHVIDALVAAGHEVVVVDTRPPHRRDAAFREGDVNDLPTLIKATKDADAIFHLAAVSNVNDAHADPVGTMELNVVATARVCEAARRNNLSRVILASTVWAYASAAATDDGVLTENTPVTTDGTGHVYTASKVAAELVVTSFGELYDVPYTVLRYGIPFGPRMREQLVIAQFVNKAANGVPITIHGDGSQYRNYVYVEDLAAAHPLVLTAEGSINQTINLEGPAPVTIREIAEVVRDLVNPALKIEFIDPRPGDFTGRPVSAAKAESVLGWAPTTSFEDGMHRYVDWWFAENQIEEREARASRRMTHAKALFLSGKFGAGHDTLADACASILSAHDVDSRIVDCMPMLGRGPAAVGNWVFDRLLSSTPIYDAFHFSQLRGDGPVGRFMDRAAVKVMFPLFVAEVDAYSPQVIVSVFSTGAAAAATLKPQRPDLITVVFMTDSYAYGMWAHDGTDLFLVTSTLAAESVRRYCPDADVRVVDAPVRPAFYTAPSRAEARAMLGVPADARCVLLMSGAWGLGPLDEVAAALAQAGYWVLAVAGTNERLARKLAKVTAVQKTVQAFGFTDQIPQMMAASNVVVTSSGDTCREARVIGRNLLLLDVVPGHGRENLMHELELGGAAVCRPTPASVLGNVRRMIVDDPAPTMRDTWEKDFIDALRDAGVHLS